MLWILSQHFHWTSKDEGPEVHLLTPKIQDSFEMPNYCWWKPNTEPLTSISNPSVALFQHVTCQFITPSSSSTCQCIKAHGVSQHPCKLPQQSNSLISNESICGGGCSLNKPHPRQLMSHPSNICSTSSKWGSRRNTVLLLSENQMLSNDKHCGCSCRAHRHLAGRYWSQEL